MNIFRAIWHGLGQIWAHKLRSVLSLLSVFLGVASLIVIIGFINGLFIGWQANIYESGGIEKLAIQDDYLPEYQKSMKSLSKGRTMEDAEAIETLCHNLSAVSPEVDLESVLISGGKTFRVRTQGVTSGIFAINRYEVDQGRILNQGDVRDRSLVVVIGHAVAEALYPKLSSPVGQTLTINGCAFTVVGKLRKYSLIRGDWDALEGKNRIAFIPITAMRDRFAPSPKLTWLNAQVKDIDLIQQTVQEISNVLTHTHRGLKDFRIVTQADRLADFESTKGSFETAGQAIGLVTLLIGGVGITNLMLASVSERMREIGLCKAVGATSMDIFIQVIAEAICLSAIGGALGVLVGAAAIPVLQNFMSASAFSPIFSMTAGIIGFSFSLLVGVVAGIYPAFKASQLDPIEALRYE
ncbi:MAG: ABC transporter permease [Candidatus Methylacidiphilales bacterium]|nr:ABC transporter permease [Candidatus Methylacidiphilales bacterium]